MTPSLLKKFILSKLLPQRKLQGQIISLVSSTECSKNKTNLTKFFKKTEVILPNTFYEGSIFIAQNLTDYKKRKLQTTYLMNMDSKTLNKRH